MTSDRHRKSGSVSTKKHQDKMGKDDPTSSEDDSGNAVEKRKKKKYVMRMVTVDENDQVDSTHGRRSLAVSAHFRNSMAVMRDVILLNPKKPSSYSASIEENNVEGKSIESNLMVSSETLSSGEKEFCLSNGSFFALRILFVDLLIACCDLASGFIQGYALISTEGKAVYGFITLGINWVPGIVAAIHVLSVYRRELAWYRAILFALLLIIFYPIVPILALLILLWMKPNNNKSTKEFKEAEYGATVVYAIRGCIESPIQICYQLWLALNGIILMEWNNLISLTITDWEGNQIFISFAAPVCIFFSILSVLKTTWDLNAIDLGRITSVRKLWQFVAFGFDLSPFLCTALFFRITAVILMLTYLNSFAFIPIAAFWITNLAIAQMLSMENENSQNKTSTWLISFIGMWVPAYFLQGYNSISKHKKEVKETQKKLYRAQSIASVLCYVPPLVACIIIVNMSTEFKYSPEIVLDNLKFNVCFGIVIAEGIISALLSITPLASAMVSCTSCKTSIGDSQKESNQSTRYTDISRTLSKKKRQNKAPEHAIKSQILHLLWSWFILFLALSPLLSGIPFMILSKDVNISSYVYFNLGSNHTFVFKTILLSTEKLDEIEKIGKISGYTRWIPTMVLSQKSVMFSSKDASKLDVYKDLNAFPLDTTAYTNTEILVMTIDTWERRRKEKIKEDSGVVGALLIDESSYRPSSPVITISHDKDTPTIYLVRQEDAKFVIEYLNQPKPIDIVLNHDIIPEPTWLCDLRKCEFGEYVGLNDTYREGYVEGNQYQTRYCFWGGKACKGYNNSQLVQPYCNGPETKLCPLDPQGFGEFKTPDEFKDPIRHLRWSPDYCLRKLYGIESQCDGRSPGWTNFLGAYDIHDINENILESKRRRYCSVKDEASGETECIFEELDIHFCCKNDQENCYDLDLC